MFRYFLFFTFFISGSRAMCQHLQLPAVFGDRMILQRDMEPPVWGKAKPNTTVTVSFAGVKRVFKADGYGAWAGTLPQPLAGKNYTLTISNGKEKKILIDVLGGDVYFAGGQSNMQYTLNEMTAGKEAIAETENTSIRLFTVPRDVAYKPRFDINRKAADNTTDGGWLLCTPETVKDFSAVAYFFARKIITEEKVPIGIINATWGGTPIEAHMSAEANHSLPYYADKLKMMEEKGKTDSLTIDKKKATPQLPSSFFNAMINPLIPFGLKGFLWYQGEHNWNNPFRYRHQFVAFINDLRIRWKEGYLPFYFVQLPNMGKKPVNPSVADFWSVLRESQSMALQLPNTGMVVAADIGDGDLHPKNKQPFGERLAALAEKNIYGKNMISEGPTPEKISIVRDTVEISFGNLGSGLWLKADSVKGFAIAGGDEKFYWANAVIKDNKVLIFSPQVTNPQAVRYGWGENPDLSLFNKEGWPAAPFRTDNWMLREDGGW